MKILVINKKRLGVTIIIIGLMVILFGLEKNFDNRVKIAALIHNNVSSLKEYKILNDKISYKIPSNWKCNEEYINGNDIIYNNVFKDEKKGISGFVQLWNYTGDLKNFIKTSKDISIKQQIDYTKYNVKAININNRYGYLVQYCILKDNNEYTAYEYFLKIDKKFIRFSFFIEDKYYQESLSTVFDTIVKSIQYKK